MRKTHNDSTAPKNQKQVELADVFRLYGDDYRRSHAVSYEQLKVMHHIQICRTAALGGHVEQCDQCAFEQIAYNSCRDRHCPKCQTLTKEKWLNDRKAELLPCGYFHLVFTLPHALNLIILSNRKTTLNTFKPLPRILSGDLKVGWDSSAYCIPGHRRSSTISTSTA